MDCRRFFPRSCSLFLTLAPLSVVRRIRLIELNQIRREVETGLKLLQKWPRNLPRSHERMKAQVNPGRHDAGDQFGRLNRSDRDLLSSSFLLKNKSYFIDGAGISTDFFALIFFLWKT